MMTEANVKDTYLLLIKLCAFLKVQHIPSVPVILLDEPETLYIGLLDKDFEAWVHFAAEVLDEANLVPFCDITTFSSSMGNGIQFPRSKVRKDMLRS